jgi:hypothetical protein
MSILTPTFNLNEVVNAHERKPLKLPELSLLPAAVVSSISSCVNRIINQLMFHEQKHVWLCVTRLRCESEGMASELLQLPIRLTVAGLETWADQESNWKLHWGSNSATSSTLDLTRWMVRASLLKIPMSSYADATMSLKPLFNALLFLEKKDMVVC